MKSSPVTYLLYVRYTWLNTLKINRLKTKHLAKHLSSHLGNSRIVLIETMGLFHMKQSPCFV